MDGKKGEDKEAYLSFSPSSPFVLLFGWLRGVFRRNCTDEAVQMI